VLQRALLGLFKGALLGTLVAVVLLQGFGLPVFSGLWAALPAAGLTGALAGLVTGRPIWSPGARLEAGLKALVGTLSGVGLLLLVRRFVPIEVVLPADLGHGPIGNLPATALPLVAALLGAFFELDDTGDGALPPAAKAGVPRAGTARGLRVIAPPDPGAEGAAADAEGTADSAPRATSEASRRPRS